MPDDNLFDDNFFSELFENDFNLAFQTFRPQGGAPNFQRFLDNQGRERAFNSFQRALGQKIEGGGRPDIKTADFLKNFNFRQDFRTLTPSERGVSNARFAPPTRFIRR